MSTTDLDTIVNRAINVALFNKRSDINSNVLRASLDAIADDWPKREDVGMLNLYLTHDCRALAKALLAIANAAEAWDEDEEFERSRRTDSTDITPEDDVDPAELFPCTHGHFDCAIFEGGPCGDEERARMLALANTPEAQQARDDDFGGVQRA